MALLEDYGAGCDPITSYCKNSRKSSSKGPCFGPFEITLAARDPDHDLQLPSVNFPYMATNGLAVFCEGY